MALTANSTMVRRSMCVRRNVFLRTSRCEVEQVFDVPGHLGHVALDEHSRAFDAAGGRSQQSRGVAHHAQRVAQFVRDDGDLIGTRVRQLGGTTMAGTRGRRDDR